MSITPSRRRCNECGEPRNCTDICRTRTDGTAAPAPESKHCGYTSDGSCWALIGHCPVKCENDDAVSTPLQSTETGPNSILSDENAETGLEPPETAERRTEAVSVDQQLRLDALLYGTTFEIRKPDGTRGRIDPTSVVMWQRSPLPPPPPTKTTGEVLGELRARLERAIVQARQYERADVTTSVKQHMFGVRCAHRETLDYLREYEQ